jgi:hypothetical protein
VAISLVSGVGGPLTLEVFQYNGGPLIDLDSLPTITITNLNNGVVAVGPTSSGVLHPTTGIYLYNWSAPVSGALYLAVWAGTISGAPFQGSEFVTVYGPSAVTVGPCEDGWEVDTSCCADWDTYTSELQEAAKTYARVVLWAATGRRFGLCSVTVRPCGRYCSGNDGANIYGYYWNGEGFFVPYLFNGDWRNCWCGFGFGCLSCQPDCQVYLDGPVNSIVNVIQDGAVVDPNTYRVDNSTWLVRTHDESDDDCWILRQDFNKGITAENTLQVTYLKGLPVPAGLARAGGELACEWAKSCLGLPCRLPQRVTSISRQGVTVSLADVDQLLENGLTGIPTVDNIIHAYNPYRLQSRMQVVSPDIPMGRRTTWP